MRTWAEIGLWEFIVRMLAVQISSAPLHESRTCGYADGVRIPLTSWGPISDIYLPTLHTSLQTHPVSNPLTPEWFKTNLRASPSSVRYDICMFRHTLLSVDVPTDKFPTYSSCNRMGKKLHETFDLIWCKCVMGVMNFFLLPMSKTGSEVWMCIWHTLYKCTYLPI